jgi:hypothetical protein
MLLRKVIKPVINHKDPRQIKKVEETPVTVEETIPVSSVPPTQEAHPIQETVPPKEESVTRPDSFIGKKKNKRNLLNLNQGSVNEKDTDNK